MGHDRLSPLARFRLRPRAVAAVALALGVGYWIVSSTTHHRQAAKKQPRDLRIGIGHWDQRAAFDIARDRKEPAPTRGPDQHQYGWEKLAQDTNMTLFLEGCVTTDESRTLINFGTDPSWQTLTTLAKDDAAGWFAVEWGTAELFPENASEAAVAGPERAPAVLIRNAENNPADCLQDIMFALLPTLYASPQFGPTESLLPVSDLTFVLTHGHGQTYCHQLLDLLGWFKNARPAQPGPICHETLLVPPYRANRFPRGRQDGRSTTFNLLARGQSPLEPVLADISAADLPLEQLVWLRDKMVAELELHRPQGASAGTMPTGENPGYTLLLNITREDQSRTWVNIADAAKNLTAYQESFDDEYDSVEVPGSVRVINSLSTLSLIDQAWLFRNADVVIGSHGDWTANAIFMRPGTAVIEIGCRQDNPEYLVAQQEMRQLCAPEPDVASFVDAKGRGCSSWTGSECTNAAGARMWYRPSEMNAVRSNCRWTCGPAYLKQRPSHGLMGVAPAPFRKCMRGRSAKSAFALFACVCMGG